MDGKKEIRLILSGQPPSKKSSQRIIFPDGRPRLLPNKLYSAWAKGARREIDNWKLDYFQKWGQKWNMIPQPVRVEIWCLFFRHTHAKVDALNLLQSVADELEKNMIYENDNQLILAAGTHVEYGIDKDKSGTIINLAYDMRDLYCIEDCIYQYVRRDGKTGCKRHKKALADKKRLRACTYWGETNDD